MGYNMTEKIDISQKRSILCFKASFGCVIWQTDPQLVSNRSMEEKLR